MKLKNKGTELDFFLNIFSGNKKDKVYLFGFGLVGRQLIETLYVNGLLAGIIDNDEKKQGQVICGKKVMSLRKFLEEEKCKEFYIVITASMKNKQVIGRQLKENGFVYGKDYFYYNEFMNRILPITMLFQKEKSFVPLAQISLTERCTLKCKKCAHACYAVANDAEDLSLDEVYKSADSFFSRVDYIQEFVLIGGEPLLYKDLSEAIAYIGDKYRKQINIFCITTNGTILPSKEVLQMCKEYNVLFRISNYAKQLPKLKMHYTRLVNVLEENNISYVLGSEETQWMDYGFEYVNRDDSEDDLIKVFSSCNTPCREIRGNKYYYCVMARSVSENLDLDVGQEDYLDLDKLTGDNYKKELLEFNLGYSEKGYLDMCRHCHGIEAKNYPIPAAEQVER